MSLFTKVQAKKPRTNTFDLSHERKMSLNMGELVPIALFETVPGDTFRMSTSQMLRFAPMIAPVMHRVTVYTHFFFVPNRIIWPNWEDFITGGDNGLDTTVWPHFHLIGPVPKGSLGDYMGLPTGVNEVGKISALPLAVYNKVYNDYYRDQNLIEEIPDELRDGDNFSNSIWPNHSYRDAPKRRAWQHDYFTSALPWTQKGPQATFPIGTEAPIIFDKSDAAGSATSLKMWNRDAVPTVGALYARAGGVLDNKSTGTVDQIIIDNSMHLKADLSNAESITINEFRRAVRLQEWLEKNARGGSRYVEQILSHFGVKVPDYRLQRPEFLGGGSTPVSISEVLQTSDASAGETPQGNMAGHGISVGKNNSFKYYCQEHGWIIGIMSVMPKTAYQQGIPKQFIKADKFDYYWPSFANLGEQPILNKELFINGDETDDDTFGYIPRYSEYKFVNDSVHGEMRDTLDFWHMGRKFDTQPRLNKDFIEANPTDRIFAVQDSEKLYAHVFNKVSARRPMPFFGTPTI